ncbi:hypothetical protein ABZ023_01650 [Streptomyces sp. NPDC006367]|uniref:hypothetical protein n=1 Tax=unclassified Streptomyces TaxID=2593676 RepID=UPI0033B3CC94
MTSVEERLDAAGRALKKSRRPFDVGAGLRRLAKDAGYLPSTRSAPRRSTPPPETGERGVPPGPKARHQLSVVARWVLNRPQAAGHAERLAQEIGANGPADQRPPLKDMDVEGALVFACMLYLAGHPESASFWWQLAAGAGDRAAAYCLHLHHLELGELKEAGHWLGQLQQDDDGPDDEFLMLLAHFAGYVRRHCPASSTMQPGLTQEVARLAARQDDGSVPVLPERKLADRLQDASRH